MMKLETEKEEIKLIELTIPDIAPSANHFYAGMNVHARRKLAHQWHGMIILAAKQQKIGRVEANQYPVEIECHCLFGKGRRILDSDNLFPTVKLTLDGLILAKILHDDSPKYVRSVKLIPTRITSKNSVSRILIITNEEQN